MLNSFIIKKGDNGQWNVYSSKNNTIIADEFKTENLAKIALKAIEVKRKIIIFQLINSDICSLDASEVESALVKYPGSFSKLAVNLLKAGMITPDNLLYEEGSTTEH